MKIKGTTSGEIYLPSQRNKLMANTRNVYTLSDKERESLEQDDLPRITEIIVWQDAFSNTSTTISPISHILLIT